jgi:hypothetical protein
LNLVLSHDECLKLLFLCLPRYVTSGGLARLLHPNSLTFPCLGPATVGHGSHLPLHLVAQPVGGSGPRRNNQVHFGQNKKKLFPKEYLIILVSYYAARANVYHLWQHPDWQQATFAAAPGYSTAWVKKWGVSLAGGTGRWDTVGADLARSLSCTQAATFPDASVGC